MTILNHDKCYTQQPQRLTITEPKNLPEDWLGEFYVLLSKQLKLNDDKSQTQEVFDHPTNTWVWLTEKEIFLKALDRHVGEQSTYSLKPHLLASLRTLYSIFMHPKTTEEQRRLIASRIKEDISECSPGFTNRVNFTITLFNMPQNQDELIALARFKLVDRIASIIATQNPQGIHVHNRVVEVARNAGYGVWPINTGDVYSLVGSPNLSDEDIIVKLQTGFANHFQLFALLNALRDELEALIAVHEYQGKRALENAYKNKEYHKFCQCLNCYVPIPMGELLETDGMSGFVTDINWQNVKHQLLQKLREEGYITFSDQEAILFDSLLRGEITSLHSETLSTLIPHGYELVQCLEYLCEWRIELKAALVNTYLNNKSLDDKKEVLAILHNEAPKLTAQLKKETSLQGIYFAIAIAEKDVASLRTYIKAGENINEALSLLFSQAHKRDTLYWLHDNPHLLKKITIAGMNSVISEGEYQGKTVAERLVSTKKGRQLLMENNTLKTLLTQSTIVDRLGDILKQAKTESSTVKTPIGFFKKPHPLAIQLVQLIVYGDLTQSEALLKANPSLLEILLREKVTVIDYSRHKIKQKTAFQASLCAMDDEICAMLTHYMSKEEMTRQYQEIFPEGHEAYYQAKNPFDFSQILTKISQSSDDDVKKALRLELPNNTELWISLEQFREAFTQLSSQEVVFNPQYLEKVFQLYDNHFNNWNQGQRDLFWRQVVGYVQRFLPANIAMDFAQGLYYRVANDEKSRRSFNFRVGAGFIFPLVFDSFLGLGYESGVAGCAWRGPARNTGGARRSFFKAYVEQKQRSFENYAARVHTQPSNPLSNSVR
jgi:hypothetical protein